MKSEKGTQHIHSCFNGAATLSLRKCLPPIDVDRKAFRLQWGRNFIVAEIKFGGFGNWLVFRASMGPQLYRCGNISLGEIRSKNHHHASMGPQLYRCGNGEMGLLDGIAVLLLQWGRNFIVAETYGNPIWFCLACGQLQWGRNFIAAEIVLDGRHLMPLAKLQWGRNFIVVEIGNTM